ncbi:undecaprenyl/decaprenyl-phosphate alpha-N-acetylglucosaminyl 1-phosphate transferase [Rudanella paleaurantiibacter]|uniref:Undecaprenyl/decaprenyl-phosphate alpha-N-acetylglucosaminyl 1-phosphate transferase n=1 Tax=Rudanella paleaurantiibacter TaxID=2614655 RepID=A0A7J5TUP4_9BACT|nr:undecaprenyl/decaprenyl-phosphate alpha-N-acetylglucosaminyl 1-phosphate transferase [Rudanella paleaurantiibacter]
MPTELDGIPLRLLGFVLGLGVCWALLPVLIRLSPRLGLVDRPNSRKVHQQLIPAIGGLTIGLALLAVSVLYTPMQVLAGQQPVLILASLVLMVTGVIDDRLNLPALVRLCIQLGCALAVTHYGIRLTSLHGLFGIQTLPLLVQYGLTMLILTGMANAFNLIDGIDGLAGSLALLNTLVLSGLAWFLHQPGWLALLCPLAGALLAFLKFNWRPARLFMGDGGSVVLGFLMVSIGMALMEGAYGQANAYAPQALCLITACCMLPVIDALRVFGSRMMRGNSPFAADRNHMHHWLLKHRFAHSEITLRLLSVHSLVVILSPVALYFLSISTVFIGQIGVTIGYTALIQLSHSFLQSYRLVKKLESN